MSLSRAITDSFPNPREELKRSYERVKKEATGSESPDVTGKFVDGVTKVLVQGGLELASVPIKFGLIPGMKLTGKAVTGAVKYAGRWTAAVLGNIPLPMLGTTAKTPNQLRFGYNAETTAKLNADSLPSPRDTGGGTRTEDGRPDVERRAA